MCNNIKSCNYETMHQLSRACLLIHSFAHSCRNPIIIDFLTSAYARHQFDIMPNMCMRSSSNYEIKFLASVIVPSDENEMWHILILSSEMESTDEWALSNITNRLLEIVGVVCKGWDEVALAYILRLFVMEDFVSISCVGRICRLN